MGVSASGGRVFQGSGVKAPPFLRFAPERFAPLHPLTQNKVCIIIFYVFHVIIKHLNLQIFKISEFGGIRSCWVL